MHFVLKFKVVKNISWKWGVRTQKQDFLNGPVKDCVSQSYTDRFKTKRRFITKNANLAKMQHYKETTGVSEFKPSADKL